MRIEKSDCLFSKEVSEALSEGFEREFAKQGVEPFRQTPLSLTIRNENNRLLAALGAKSAWGWMHIDVLWVTEAARGNGFGRALMDEAERQAKARGCVGLSVWTHSFQAPAFYEKLGYERYFELENVPPGESRIGFRKIF